MGCACSKQVISTPAHKPVTLGKEDATHGMAPIALSWSSTLSGELVGSALTRETAGVFLAAAGFDRPGLDIPYDSHTNH